MNEAPKCGYCAIMGETPHCHNCKIFNKVKSTPRAPQELPYKLKDLIAYIENPDNSFDENLQVGDYFWISLTTGEKLKAVLLEKERDKSADNTTLKTTFGVESSTVRIVMDPKSRYDDYPSTQANQIYLPHLFKLFPKALREAIKPALKMCSSAGERKHEAFPLWLFSEGEITNNYYTTDTCERYEYFTKDANRIAWFGSGKQSWLRSVYSGSYCYTNSNYTNGVTYANPANAHGVSFGFCI